VTDSSTDAARGAVFKIVKGGEVYAPEPLGRQDILVCNDRIVGIGTGFDEKARALGPVEVFDVKGKLVVPGFIDQHIHFLGGGDGEGPLGRVPELHLSWITSGGVTTAVGIMGIDMEFKGLHGLLVKARELDRSGLSTYIYAGSFEVPSPFLTKSVRADLSLIDKVVGVKVAIAEDTYPNLSLEKLARLAGELKLARRISGKAAVMHCHTGRGKRRLDPIFQLLDAVDLPIEQVLPTHLNRQVPDYIEHAVKFARMGGTIDFSAILSRRCGSVTGMGCDEAVRRELDAGVGLHQITLSSDANVSMPVLDPQDQIIGLFNTAPGVLLREWRYVVRTNKLKLEQALPLVTSNVARVLRLDDRKGALKVGHDADILVLTPDLAVDGVLCRGMAMIRDGRVLAKGPFEDEAKRHPGF